MQAVLPSNFWKIFASPKTGVIGLPYCENSSILGSAISATCDERTDRQTETGYADKNQGNRHVTDMHQRSLCEFRSNKWDKSFHRRMTSNGRRLQLSGNTWRRLRITAQTSAVHRHRRHCNVQSTQSHSVSTSAGQEQTSSSQLLVTYHGSCTLDVQQNKSTTHDPSSASKLLVPEISYQ